MVTTEKVQTTKDEREDLVKKAVELFNLTFDEWGITHRNSVVCVKEDETDEETRPLRPDDIKLTQVKTKLGHLINVPGDTPEESYWKLGVNMYFLQNTMSVEEKTGFLLHELSHAPAANIGHDSEYWDTLATVVNNALRHTEQVSEIMGGDIRSDTLRDYTADGIRVADDVNNKQEQLKTFCDAIDYNPKYVGAFGSQVVSFSQEAVDEAMTTVPVGEITVENEVRDWRLYAAMDKHAPVGSRTGDKIRFLTPLFVESEKNENGEYVANRGAATEAKFALLKRIDNYTSREVPEIPIKTK